jgi:LysM repeat protein
VEIVETPVEFHEVQDIESVEAKIREGQETVEEYTVKEGDTFWSISKAFDIDHDELLRMNAGYGSGKIEAGPEYLSFLS